MTTPTKTTLVHRLTPEVYEALVKGLPAPFVQGTTTELQAGFMLGIQHVLGIIRAGVVIGA